MLRKKSLKRRDDFTARPFFAPHCFNATHQRKPLRDCLKAHTMTFRSLRRTIFPVSWRFRNQTCPIMAAVFQRDRLRTGSGTRYLKNR